MTSPVMPVLVILLVIFVATVAVLCWHIRKLADATLNLQLATSEFRRHVEHRLDRQDDKLHVIETRTQPAPS